MNIVELFQNIGREAITKSILIFLLLIASVLLANLVRNAINGLSKKMKLDNKIKIGKKIQFTEIISNFTVFIIYLVFINSAIEIIDIKVLTEYFKLLTDLVINIFAGTLIIILGYVISGYIRRKILETRFDHSKLIGEISFVFIMIISIQIALKIIGIPTNLLESIIIIIIASIGLGLAIAIGFGLKDVVADFARKNFKS
ncbi:MAG: hypothetical protein QXM68_03445 [Candidatus Aenigmatarchaeota archaeon]|nr:hypothetical protein [Candidatus Aenigmarchaeota archaeon]